MLYFSTVNLAPFMYQRGKRVGKQKKGGWYGSARATFKTFKCLCVRILLGLGAEMAYEFMRGQNSWGVASRGLLTGCLRASEETFEEASDVTFLQYSKEFCSGRE